MSSILALISKAVFEATPMRHTVGVVAPLDRYTSKHAAFGKLAAGDALFLVTVRRKALWLVAIIEAPHRQGDAVVGATNVTPMTDLTGVLPKIKLADGKGIKVAIEKLGMSLQTPRVLADEDVSLLRGFAPKGERKATVPAVQMKVAPKKSADALPELEGGKLGKRAKALLEQVYSAPDDRALRQVLADQLLEDQHVWGELITLQMAKKEQHAERIEKIIKRYARDFVGEIANIVSRAGMTFEDGFLVEACTDKSRSFTSAPDRAKAARAPQWATVKTVILGYDAPTPFREALLHNAASRHLTAIVEDGGYDGHTTLLSQGTGRCLGDHERGLSRHPRESPRRRARTHRDSEDEDRGRHARESTCQARDTDQENQTGKE